MKYIPEEHTLIDYLYGTLKADERKKVEQYLEEHPEVKQELLNMQETREIMGKYEDREVLVPEMFDEPLKENNTFNSVPYLKTVLSIAASISIILLIGYISDLKITYSNNQLTIRFGEDIKRETKQQPQESNAVDYDKLQAMVVKTMNDNQPESIDQNALKNEIMGALISLQKENHKAIENKLNQFMAGEKLALENHAQAMQAENLETMEQYLATVTLEQRAYLEDVLVDFTNYMEEQRLQDRQFYVNNLVDLKLETDLQQQETEQLLTSIMNKVNEIPNENETQNF